MPGDEADSIRPEDNAGFDQFYRTVRLSFPGGVVTAFQERIDFHFAETNKTLFLSGLGVVKKFQFAIGFVGLDGVGLLREIDIERPGDHITCGAGRAKNEGEDGAAAPQNPLFKFL